MGGTDLPGLNPASVTCVKQGGKINIGSGSAGGQQALAVVMTDEASPRIESLALVVDGNALSVSDNMGAKVGSAKVAVDGKTYTITGQAQGADLKNPMAGMITKDFNIKVTCG
ncbi:lipoantigen family protein [Mycobacterium kansasii]|uniref:Lipoantigen family protein n=1 Tax=Mycobacterium kansasii TaxID=1768 RepID=A0A1V3XCV6_MYCKA|nr:lipoantigen family protein [Mycobacterium kansasii]